MFILVVYANGQQIGSIDLTKPPALEMSAERKKEEALPNNCEKLGGGTADGAVITQKGQPLEIIVEVKSLNSKEPNSGSEMQAEIRLRNHGKGDIKIPWGTNPEIAEMNQDSNNLHWEVGSFRILLDRSEVLKHPGQPLYGSEFSKGSILTIQPGQWITAMVKFRLELEYPLREQVVRTGKRQLRIEWEQAAYTKTLDEKKCQQWNGYFKYFYQQINPAVAITIVRDRSSVQ
jgi:hypothetical protein